MLCVERELKVHDVVHARYVQPARRNVRRHQQLHLQRS
jgi:hypothetical protein